MKRKWNDEGMAIAVAASKTYTEVMRRLGLGISCGNWRTIKYAIERLHLDTSHMTGKAHGTTLPKNKRSLDDVMVKGSTYNTGHLKKRLIQNGTLKNECCICGQQPKWMDKPLAMVIDHINGISNDNRVENLRLLCPNCNSQQVTFSRGTRGFKMQSLV